MQEYRFIAEYELETPLRLSSGDQAGLADIAVRRRADGALIIPGTSIGGACRQYVEELTEAPCLITSVNELCKENKRCGCNVCNLFGDVNPGATESFPSKLIFSDSPISDALVRIRDGVAIERKHRVVAARKKFDYEEIAPGASVAIEVRGKNLTGEELCWIGSTLEAIGVGAVPLGGRRAQGLGRLKTTALSLHKRDTENTDHFLKLLLAQGSNDAWAEEISPIPRLSKGDDSDSIILEIAPIIGGTFAVGDPCEAVRTGFDRAPRLSGSADILPASSFRGALRTASERIVRSISPNSACDPTDKESSCAAKARNEKNGDKRTELQRCLTCRLFGNEDCTSWLRIDVRERATKSTVEVPFDHVAIDRFTGGAREGLKFDSMAVSGGDFSVRCSMHRVPKRDLRWASALLALALQELNHGRTNVGYGSARGHGWFQITSPPKFGVDLRIGVKDLWEQLNVRYPEDAP